MTVIACHKESTMAATMEPVYLQDVAFFSMKNCCVTAIISLSIHPTLGLSAQLKRGDTSFNLQMNPDDFCSFAMSEFPIIVGDGITGEPVAVTVIHLALSVSAAERLHDQFTGTLLITNLHGLSSQKSSADNTIAFTNGSYPTIANNHRQATHNALVVVLQSSQAGKQTSRDMLHMFSVARMTSTLEAISQGFSPKLVEAAEMENMLSGCGELSNVLSVIRSLHMYCARQPSDTIGQSNIRSLNTVLPSTDQKRPATITLSKALALASTKSASQLSNRTTRSAPSQTVVITNGRPLRSVGKRKMELTTDLTDSPDNTPASSANGGDAGDDDLGPPLLRNPVPIYQRDLDCLKPGFYINDTIVDFYLKYIVENFEAKHGPGKAYAFSSLFYSQLTRPQVNVANSASSTLTPADRRYENVRNWVRRLHKLFSTDYIFIPVNVNQHWLLVIVQYISDALKNSPADHPDGSKLVSSNGESSKEVTNRTPAIIVLDSMASAHPIVNAHYHVARYVRQFLESDARTRNLVLDSTRLRDIRPRVPQQNNATDCALFVCQYAECFLEDPQSLQGSEIAKNGHASRSSSPEPTSQAPPPPSIKRQSSCVVLLVRDAESNSASSVRRVVVPQTSLSPPAATSTVTFQVTPNLLSWFPNERVAKKRQEILQLLQKLISDSLVK